MVNYLVKLGAKVVGISLKNNEKYNHFNLVKNKINVKSYFFDICQKKLENVVIKEKPDYIFHLAAQSIVYKSILNPRFNWETNVMGLFNLLEAINKIKKCCAVIITSDKCYKNLEIKRDIKKMMF